MKVEENIFGCSGRGREVVVRGDDVEERVRRKQAQRLSAGDQTRSPFFWSVRKVTNYHS